MFHYFWAHFTYHLIRWFPRNNRLKIRIVLLIFTVALWVPQLVILVHPHSVRYCGQHLFQLLIISIVFTFCMTGFAFLFTVMDPVPQQVKIAFHIFGVLSFTLGCVTTALTAMAADCRVFTTELYWLQVALSAFSILATLWFVLVVPFWLVNQAWTDSVYDYRTRSGICYDPVTCCSCVWHI